MRAPVEGLVQIAGNAVLDVLVRGTGLGGPAAEVWSDNVQTVRNPVDGVLGGCGAATAYVLGGLGQQVVLNTNLGQDVWGDTLRNWLESVEVDIAGLKAARTAVHVIALDAVGRRQSHYYRGEKVDWRASLQLPVPQVFFAAGYGSVESEDAADLHAVFSALRRRGTLVVFDVSPWFAGRVEVEQMHALWKQIDCLVGTEEELLVWQDAENAEDLAQRVLDRGVERVVVKRGADGALFATRDGAQGQVDVRPISAGNSVGAGDCFNGRLLYGLAQGEALYDAVSAAADLATRIVERGRGALGAFDTQRRKDNG
ncbi:MAG: carbohydrate kinase family protein [Candidatus Latescibacterota bacterium]